jgi:hypothetical protein
MAIHIKDKTIREATKQVRNRIRECIKALETSRESIVKTFYIGKTYVRHNKSGNQSFNPEDRNHWTVKGIYGRYFVHSKEEYGKDGLIVLAIVTDVSIPEDCKQNWYLMEPEEYTLTLERRTIQYYQEIKDQRLINEFTDPGRTDGEKSIAYIVYMAFAMESKWECL